MSGDLSDINWDDIPEPTQRDNGPLAAGVYPVKIEAACVKEANSGNGKYAEVQFRVTEGTGANRCVWARLNFQHSNPVAERIGLSQLKKLAMAIGLQGLTETLQLVGGELEVTVTAREYNGKVYNDVKDFHPVRSAAPKKAMVFRVEPDTSGGGSDDVPW